MMLNYQKKKKVLAMSQFKFEIKSTGKVFIKVSRGVCYLTEKFFLKGSVITDTSCSPKP